MYPFILLMYIADFPLIFCLCYAIMYMLTNYFVTDTTYRFINKSTAANFPIKLVNFACVFDAF